LKEEDVEIGTNLITKIKRHWYQGAFIDNVTYFQSCSPFQTWEASPFPAAPYRPMPLADTLGQKARKAAIELMAL
jgi:hypothetical protein